MKSFIEKCVLDIELIKNIDDYVDYWHCGKDAAIGFESLYDYLGMTRDDYAKWIKNPEFLNILIDDYKNLYRCPKCKYETSSYYTSYGKVWCENCGFILRLDGSEYIDYIEEYKRYHNVKL